jgi:lipopolysaccharide/colanic/teichoic acid biosynthesis glycosyltransferase
VTTLKVRRRGEGPRLSASSGVALPTSSARSPSERDGDGSSQVRRAAVLAPIPAARISPGLGRRDAAAKRVLDLAGASIGLLVLAPLLAATALLIIVVDGRPALFRQERAGLNRRPFQIVKFRTMHNGADARRAELRAHNEVSGSASFKMTNDPRTTRLGRILRKTSLDELPQLWNVLNGEMSLVGPRPHPFDDVAGYRDWHHGRFAVKPGITGLWQISSRGDTDFDRWVELDLEYIEHWSFGSDLAILVRTFPAIFRADGR